MITLYGFGSYFGLPDQSPLVMKTMVQLTMAGLAFDVSVTGYMNAPKGKLPYIRDGEETIADSTFIRKHIETKYGADLDSGLNDLQRVQAWTIERMVEDHLLWAITYVRWTRDENYAKACALFAAFPQAMRGSLAEPSPKRMLDGLQAQGFGRHSEEDVTELCSRSLGALSTHLGDKAYLFGERPAGVDATAFGVLACLGTDVFDTKLTRKARSFANLMAYRERMMAKYFPEFGASA
ncbi:MAG: glutathione S-transferase family protein [Proteobacteria bacterium]|nr:glutathione S-transferase family protein [Pseudomonadota bacterium]